jgi:hypothetical protein
MGWWPWGGKRREPAVAAAHSTPPVISSAEHDGAWRDLPAMQRTLADPLGPIAINVDFRDSLASYADPSFVAPLAHQVDPEAGGLVEGLVSLGIPYANASGPELAVPRRPKPAAARTSGRSKNPGQIHTQRVQRRAISSRSADLSSSADIPTVALELAESPTPDSPLWYADSEASTLTDPGALAPTEAMLPPEAAPRTEAVLPPEAAPRTEAVLPPEAVLAPEAATPTEAPTLTSGATSSTAPADAPSSRPTVSSDAPPIAGAGTRGATESAAGEAASNSAGPSRQLPVVARSVDHSHAELPLLPRNRAPAVPSRSQALPATGSMDLPVVSRLAESAEGSAPLSGFAEAIIKLNGPAESPADSGKAVSNDDHVASSVDQVASSDDHAAIGEDQIATSGDHHAASALPSASLPVQRVASEGQSAGGEIELPVVAESFVAKVVPDSSLPVLSSQADAGSTPAETSGQRQIEARIDAPTLGIRLVQAPLTVQRAPMTKRVSAPVEPAAQRVEFLAPYLAPPRRSSGSSSAQSRDQGPAPTSAPTSAAPATAATGLTAQRLPSQDGKRVSNSARKHLLAVSKRETQLEETRVEPTQLEERQVEPTQVEDIVARASVQRLEPLDPVTSGPAVTPEFSVPSEMRAKALTREVHPVTVDLPIGPAAGGGPTAPAVAQLPAGRRIADLPMLPSAAERPAGRAVADVPTVATAPEVQLGPAVIAELWTSAAETSASGPEVPTGHSSFQTVSRFAAGAPTYPTSGSARSNPKIAVGPALPVQRVAALRAPSSGAVSSSLIVSRQVTADAASPQSRSGAVSFVSMFGSEDAREAGSPVEDGYTSVQLQPAGESGPPASESAADMSAPPVSSAPPPPAGTGPPADLDEMARRLYEPLSARVKAELWLDRERGGMMIDAY